MLASFLKRSRNRRTLLSALLFAGVPLAACALTLTWDASVSPEVIGYKIYWGTASGTYSTTIDVGPVLTHTIPDGELQAPGVPNYLAATAYSVAEESGFSNEVVYVIQTIETALVAAWGFPEGGGATSADQSGNTHTLTLQGGATWTASGHTATGLALNGTAQYATTPHVDDLSLGNTGTLEAWVWLAALGRWHGILSKGTANSNPAHNYALEVTDANLPICVIGTGSAAHAATGGSALTSNTWYHLACTWDGTTLLTYVNGTQVASVAQTLTPVGNTAPLSLGQFGDGFDRLQGVLDDVRMYNTARTGGQILTDMHTPVWAGIAPAGATNATVHFTP